MKVQQTNYPGVYYILVHRTGQKGKEDKSFIVSWYDYKTGKVRQTRVGREWRDNMTAAKANIKRTEFIRGAPTRSDEKKQKKVESDAKWTLSRIYERYLIENPRLRSVMVMKNIWEKHIYHFFGDLVPHEIEESDLNEFKDFLLGDRYSNKFSEIYKERFPKRFPNDKFMGYSKSYVNSTLEIIRRVTIWGSRNIKVNGIYIRGLSFRIKLIKNVNNEKTGYLSVQERGNLIKAAQEYPYRLIGNLILFLFYTGCRKGESFHLKWEDIKWNENTIELVETKSGVKQYIPLTEILIEFLKTHKKEFPPQDSCPYVFPSKNGKMLKNIRKTAKAIFKNAGLPDDFRIHDIRHAYACALVEKGVEIQVVSKLLRHGSITITEKRYARFSPTYLGNKAEKIGDVVREALGEEKSKILPFPKNID